MTGVLHHATPGSFSDGWCVVSLDEPPSSAQYNILYYITLHYITLHGMTLHNNVTLHDIALKCYITITLDEPPSSVSVPIV